MKTLHFEDIACLSFFHFQAHVYDAPWSLATAQVNIQVNFNKAKPKQFKVPLFGFF